MEIKRAMVIALLLLIAVCLVDARLSEAQGSMQRGAAPPTVTGGQGQSHPQVPQSYGYGTQANPHAPQAQSGVGNQYSDGTPNYPYPPYHNPYYDAGNPRHYLTQTVEWVFALPAMVMDSVSNVLDNNFFPRVPATQGGPPPAGASASSQPQAPQQPLPRAETYSPASR